jgi:hypothetical protein
MKQRTTGRSRRTFRPQRKTGQKLKSGATPEKVIQKQILVWLESTGLLYWRQNAGFVGHITLGPPGISDIVVILGPNGRFLGLEVKSAVGRLRPEQKSFRDRLESSGGIYCVVRTLAEAQEAVRQAIIGNGGIGEACLRVQLQSSGTATGLPGSV